MIDRRNAFKATIAAVALLASMPAWAAGELLKVGLILPMTGPFASTGRQIKAAADLYLAEHGADVAGRTIELVIKDDGGVADQTKRLAQELIVQDKVGILAGFGLTPLALATAPLSMQAKVPMVVMAAVTSSITEKSPYVARTSYTVQQGTSVIAEWAAKQGINKVVTVVSDYGPGVDGEKGFSASFTKAGGTIVESMRVPLQNPDFSPFLQRVADLKPDAVFVFVPSGIGAPFMKQFVERGLDKAGIRLLADGSMTDDDNLNAMGEPARAAATVFHYSAAHDSPENKAFVEAFQAANPGMRPNFMAVGGYDGMHLIYAALEKSGGKSDGQTLINAMKGLSWQSPRGPISIDPETRDIVQNIYMRKVDRGANNELWNIEFATTEAVKDPGKAAAK